MTRAPSGTLLWLILAHRVIGGVYGMRGADGGIFNSGIKRSMAAVGCVQGVGMGGSPPTGIKRSQATPPV